MTAATATTTTPVTEAGTATPSRRVLVVLALVYVAFFAVLLLTGAEHDPEDDPAKLIAGNDTSHLMISVTSYFGMITCAVLVFFGAALRAALVSRGRRWTADVAGAGFVLMAVTVASWVVSALALWHAEDLGDEAAVRAMLLIDTSNFLPIMVGLICVLAGTGLTGLLTGVLPRWLAIVSIVLGCLSPLGPAAFAPFALFPVWMIVVAAMVRLDQKSV
jgi:hypothetical protein